MKLKQGLLYMILDNPSVPNKYSKSFLNLKNVLELEQQEKDFKITDKIIQDFKEVENLYNDFINGVPLKVIETYFRSNNDSLDDYVYIEYQEKEVSNMKFIDIYVKMEEYFEKVFAIACDIANLYNLEIKLNKGSKESIEMI